MRLRLFILILSAFGIQISPLAAQPNVLLIISDDQGYGDCGFTGSKIARTPQLDALAAESARMTNFISAPACSPTRVAIATGRDHLLAGTWGVGTRGHIWPDEKGLGEFFHEAGYSTAHIGKWGEGWLPDSLPHRRGYDEMALVGGYAHRDPVLNVNGTGIAHTGWTTDILVDSTLRFIAKNRGKAWCATTAFIAMHSPWVCDAKYSQPYLDAGHSPALAACYGLLSQMDDSLGRLLRGLHDLGEEDNTIVLFVSDNGATPKCEIHGEMTAEDWGKRNIHHLRGHKAEIWEGGIRVPCLVRWPRRIPAGDRAQFGAVEDILPTLLDLAGIQAKPALPFTGSSLRSVLARPDTKTPERTFFRMIANVRGATQGIANDPQDIRYELNDFALRGPRYKLVSERGKTQLFDLQTDPAESHDLSGENPALAQKMAAECQKRFEAIQASKRAFQMPRIPIGDPRFENEPQVVSYTEGNAIPATMPQRLSGQMRVTNTDATGLTTAADSITYAIDVRTAGRYVIALNGRDLDACAPLQLHIGKQIITTKDVRAAGISFGIVELASGPQDLTLSAIAPSKEVKAATLRKIKFTRVIPAAARGLRVATDGTLTLDGRPWRGVGINFFDAFMRVLLENDTRSMEDGFAAIAEARIPFVRLCGTCFWPIDQKIYLDDPQRYWAAFDQVVKTAEKHRVGLIPSLFWLTNCVPDLVGEPVSAWGDPQSRTHGHMRRYVQDITTRYKDSSAIWAWEFGNEYSLAADLPQAEKHRPYTHVAKGCPATRSEKDDLTSAIVITAFTEFAKAVRQHDPHRLISTGDSSPRLSAFHLWKKAPKPWDHDTQEQFAEVFRIKNPEGISLMSVHAYQDDWQRFDWMLSVSRELNKPLLIGEFGSPGDEAEGGERLRKLLGAILDKKVPLACLWNYDLPSQKDFNITPTHPTRAYQWQAIVEANARIRRELEDGKE